MNKSFLAFLVSGIWVSLSEFIRNELVLKSYWIEKYSRNGMVFPSEPVNIALWSIWSFLLAGLIVFLLRRIRFGETVVVVWLPAFAMMWIVIGNLNVLPSGLLVFAIPWSMLEVAIAAWLGSKLLGHRTTQQGTL